MYDISSLRVKVFPKKCRYANNKLFKAIQ